MSEHTLYIRKTKGGHVLPPVTLDELLALVEAGGVAGDDELKVVGMRIFPSDESWAPIRDYPEVSRFFGASGRAQVKAEIKKAKASWLYAACAVLICLLAAFVFWWNPYVDAKDSAGEVTRLKGLLEAANGKATGLEARIKKEAETATLARKALEAKLAASQKELTAKNTRLDEVTRDAELHAGVAYSLSSKDSAARAENSSLKKRVEELDGLPRFWPGAESLQVPESGEEVRLLSTLPDEGYLYVIGAKSYAVGTVLELNQGGLFGSRVFARVVNSYAHAGGGNGMALHVPGLREEDVSRIRKLRLGEALKCSVSLNFK